MTLPVPQPCLGAFLLAAFEAETSQESRVIFFRKALNGEAEAVVVVPIRGRTVGPARKIT